MSNQPKLHHHPQPNRATLIYDAPTTQTHQSPTKTSILLTDALSTNQSPKTQMTT